MNIIYTKSYDKSIKVLNKRKEEKEVLEDILSYLRNINNFNILLNDPLAKMYGFERLKYDLKDFYSFRLSRTIRLIVKPKDNNIEIYLIYLSKNHYEDFDIGKVMFYE